MTPTNTGRTHHSSILAFPRHVDYAYAATRYRRRLIIDGWVTLCALVLLGVASAFIWF